MNFLYPGFLIAFAVLAVPILIHLFNFQKFKKVYFSNVRFLKQINQETESRSKLKKILILLSRILALSSLVLTFAQPFLLDSSVKLKSGKKAVSIYIDNSFSLQAESSQGNLFELERKKAREIIAAFGNSDRFQILSNDFEGKHQRLVNKEVALQMLNELQLSPAFKTIDEVYLRQKDLLTTADFPDKRIYQLSDLQRSAFSAAITSPDTSIAYNLLPIQSASSNNVFIDSIWFTNPVNQIGMNQTIQIQIKNKSNLSVENSAIKLFINSFLIASTSFSAEPEQTVTVPITFLVKDSGIKHAVLSLEDYPVTYDDKFYFSFQVKKSIPVLLINDTETNSAIAIRSLFKNDSLFNFSEESASRIDFANFIKNDLILINGLKSISTGLISELRKFKDAGGSIGFFPELNGNKDEYNNLLVSLGGNGFSSLDTINSRLEKIEDAHPFFQGVFDKKPENVDLPKVNSHFKINPGGEILLRLLNGDIFLTSYKQKGKLYVFSTSLNEDAGNFVRHALFVPVMIKMAITSRSSAIPYYTCGNSNTVFIQTEKGSKENPIKLVSVQNKKEFIPEQRVSVDGIVLNTGYQPEEAGNFYVKKGEVALEGLSFNYSRKESDLTQIKKDELLEMVNSGKFPKTNILDATEANLTSVIASDSYGKKLWKVFLILTLLFFSIEIALIRLLK